jgi:LPXTG-site transpeptidase (sortase) family protein
MVLSGVSLLAAVAQDLVGTTATTAHAQAVIRREVAQHGLPRQAIPGRAVGFISIDVISVDVAFVEGVSSGDLATGPGHYPQTPLPGQGGNTVIAGHRTTHGAPFWSLDVLRPGDLIGLQTRRGRFVYRVTWKSVLPQDAWGPTELAPGPALTLTTCWPRFSSKQRLVVQAIQVYGRIPGGFIGLRGSPPTA